MLLSQRYSQWTKTPSWRRKLLEAFLWNYCIGWKRGNKLIAETKLGKVHCCRVVKRMVPIYVVVFIFDPAEAWYSCRLEMVKKHDSNINQLCPTQWSSGNLPPINCHVSKPAHGLHKEFYTTKSSMQRILHHFSCHQFSRDFEDVKNLLCLVPSAQEIGTTFTSKAQGTCLVVTFLF